jgi:hypothetical protein
MLTAKETENLITQINKSFEEDRKRLQKLEDRVKQLETAAKPTKRGGKDDE